MKKTLSGILVALYLVVSVIGCSGNADVNAGNANPNAAVEQPPVQATQLFSNDINTDILTRHLLPSFERMEEKDRAEYVESLQVYRKIAELGLDKNEFLFPERNLEKLRKELMAIASEMELEKIDFSGTASEDLQSVIEQNAGKEIHLLAPKINVTSTLRIPSNTYLVGSDTEFAAEGCEYVLLVENAQNVVLDSLCLNGGADYGIFIAGSENVLVKNCKISGVGQKGICVTGGSRLFCIQDNEITENGAGGIYCAGNVSEGWIRNNAVHNNFGTSNWMAGIVLSNAATENPLNIWEKFDENHRCPARDNLYLQTDCAHKIIVENNVISQNNASGFYSDGSYGCFLINNDIFENDKEGVCLDNGTIGTFLCENRVKSNGGRYRQTDDDLRMDYVLDAGRLEDGSAKSKLPGVSLDNTAYNIIQNNLLVGNYGGGIKMVRSTIRCLIMENVVKDNNRGQNDLFHFFGIELGAAIPDEPVPDMDFTSDFENIVCRNTISGDHYSGIFLGENCYVNDIFDNVIMEPQMFSIECISIKFNSIVNNFSNADVRNEFKE